MRFRDQHGHSETSESGANGDGACAAAGRGRSGRPSVPHVAARQEIAPSSQPKTRSREGTAPTDAVIVGCGYTGRRVARLLLDRGWSVTATSRNPDGLSDLRERGAVTVRFDMSDGPGVCPSVGGSHVLLSVPTLRPDGAPEEPTPGIVAAFDGIPCHVTYLSTTGVYGATREVGASTPAAPRTQRQHLRLVAERAVRSQGCESLVLRPAAIYGPGRGVHSALRQGRFRLAAKTGRFVSRIHVDDLSAIVAAAMEQRLVGTFPVADRLPSPSSEVAAFCAEQLGLAMPPSVPDESLSETRRSDRRVDGRAILGSLGLDLRYPTYLEGIVACLAAERSMAPSQ